MRACVIFRLTPGTSHSRDLQFGRARAVPRSGRSCASLGEGLPRVKATYRAIAPVPWPIRHRLSIKPSHFALPPARSNPALPVIGASRGTAKSCTVSGMRTNGSPRCAVAGARGRAGCSSGWPVPRTPQPFTCRRCQTALAGRQADDPILWQPRRQPEPSPASASRDVVLLGSSPLTRPTPCRIPPHTESPLDPQSQPPSSAICERPDAWQRLGLLSSDRRLATVGSGRPRLSS